MGARSARKPPPSCRRRSDYFVRTRLPQFSIPWVLRTASLANLGRGEETQASAQRLRELWPSFTIREYLGSNFTSPERLAMFDEALRLAGIPDG